MLDPSISRSLPAALLDTQVCRRDVTTQGEAMMTSGAGGIPNLPGGFGGLLLAILVVVLGVVVVKHLLEN